MFMFKTASFVTTITFAGMISIGTAASALACDNFIGTATRGVMNSTTLETWGDQYVSLDQDGDGNRVRGRAQGRCNGLVMGQYGDGNHIMADIAGRHNAVGMLQNADDVRARTKVIGDRNGVAIYQSRSGSRASVDIAGAGNRVVTNQH